MGWVVYIIRCGDGTLYTGCTTDMKRRLHEHRSGRGAAYTRGRGPLKLLWKRRARNRSWAQRFEARIKALTRLQKLLLSKPGGGVLRLGAQPFGTGSILEPVPAGKPSGSWDRHPKRASPRSALVPATRR